MQAHKEWVLWVKKRRESDDAYMKLKERNYRLLIERRESKLISAIKKIFLTFSLI